MMMSNIRIILGGGRAGSAGEFLKALDCMVGCAPTINMFLPPRREAEMLPQLLDGLTEQRLHWQLTETITLTGEDVAFLPDAVIATAAARPPAQEIWLRVDPNAPLRYDRLRPALNDALDAYRRIGGPQLRCMDFPLCAADERHWRMFMTRQERRRLLSFPSVGISTAVTELPLSPVCSDCLAGGYCPGLYAAQTDAGLTCLTAGSTSAPLLQFHGTDSPLLHLSRYTDVSLDPAHLHLKNRLYGVVVTIAVTGAQQQRLLGALRYGVAEAELLSLLQRFGVQPTAFESMLQGCVIE